MKYQNSIIHILIVTFLTLTFSIFSISAYSQSKNTVLEIGSEGEIPTLIKYGDKISGFSSNTLYVGITINKEEYTSHLLILSFNATIYGLADIITDQGSTRSYAYMMGWWPINPLVWSIAADGPGNDYINLFSPGVGYSYIVSLPQKFELSVTGNSGVAYGQINKPDMNAWENSEGDNVKKLESYEEFKSINNKFGCRANIKLKFIKLISNFKIGISAGYTHYIFSDINFNSYDLGTFASFMF